MCFKHVTLSILQTLVIATLLIFSLFLLFTGLVVKGHFRPCFLIYIYPWMKMLLVAFKYLLHHCAQCLAIVQSLLINKIGIFKRTNSRDFVLVNFLIGRTPKVLQNMMQYQLHSPTSALPTARNTSFSHLPAWRSWNTICNTLARTLPVYLSLF